MNSASSTSRGIPAALEIIRGSGGQLLRVTVRGTEGVAYAVEVTSNLIHWTRMRTNRSPFSFEQPIGSNESSRFLRAVTVD